MPLREHGAQPRRQTAPAVKVAEERLTFAVLFPGAVEIGVERVGQIARAARRIECVGGAIQVQPLFRDEVFPRRIASGRAAARKRQIPHMQRPQVLLDLCGRRIRLAKRVTNARLQRPREVGLRDGPRPGIRLAMKARDKGGRNDGHSNSIVT